MKFAVSAVDYLLSCLHQPELLVLESSQCGATAERRTRDREVPCSKLAFSQLFFSIGKKLIGTVRWLSSLGMLIGPSPHHCSPIGVFTLECTGVRPSPLKCENEYLVFAEGE